MAFGAILGKLASKFIPQILPSLIGGAVSLKGGKDRNVAASAQAQRQMDFQERMSSTAHAREVADLRKAGLNPILSATGGRGASSPGGAQAPVQDVLTPAVNSALSARRLTQEIKNLKATEGLVRAQTSAIQPAAAAGNVIEGAIDNVSSLRDALSSDQGRLWLEETWKDITAIFNRTGHNSARAVRDFISNWSPAGRRGTGTQATGGVRIQNPRTGEWITGDK